jgi:hypothetical protein
MLIVLLSSSPAVPEVAVTASSDTGEDEKYEHESSIEFDDVLGLFGEAVGEGEEGEEGKFEH